MPSRPRRGPRGGPDTVSLDDMRHMVRATRRTAGPDGAALESRMISRMPVAACAVLGSHGSIRRVPACSPGPSFADMIDLAPSPWRHRAAPACRPGVSGARWPPARGALAGRRWRMRAQRVDHAAPAAGVSIVAVRRVAGDRRRFLVAGCAGRDGVYRPRTAGRVGLAFWFVSRHAGDRERSRWPTATAVEQRCGDHVERDRLPRRMGACRTGGRRGSLVELSGQGRACRSGASCGPNCGWNWPELRQALRLLRAPGVPEMERGTQR